MNPHPFASQIKILQAPDPQLVVVKGLLLDRMQKLDSGTVPVIVRRKARASYGVVCKTKYNPNIHFNEELRKDPLDGEMYAIGQIDWVIKKVRGMRLSVRDAHALDMALTRADRGILSTPATRSHPTSVRRLIRPAPCATGTL